MYHRKRDAAPVRFRVTVTGAATGRPARFARFVAMLPTDLGEAEALRLGWKQDRP